MRRHIPLFLAFAAFHSGLGWAQQSYGSRPQANGGTDGDTERFSSRAVYEENIRRAGQNEITFASLRSLVESQGVRTVEQLLAILPEELKQRYTLIYSSHSRQHASFEDPRVLFFNRDASLLLTVASRNSSDPGDHVVEVIEMPRGQNRFQPRHILFENGGVRFVTQRRELQDCFVCHRENFRPNWHPYDRWPGVYGSSDGFIKVGSRESQALKELFRRWDQHPRLRFLPQLWLGPESQRPSGAFVQPLELSSFEAGRRDLVNNLLTQLISDRNLSRLTKDWAERDGGRAFRAQKYLMSALALDCGRQDRNEALVRLMPAVWRARSPYTYERFRAFISRQMVEEDRAALEEVVRYNAALGFPPPPTFAGDRIAQFAYALHLVGMDLDEYSLTRSHGSYNFTTPAGGGDGDLVGAFIDRILASSRAGDPGVALLRQSLSHVRSFGPYVYRHSELPQPPAEKERICQRLAAYSRAAMSQYVPAPGSYRTRIPRDDTSNPTVRSQPEGR